LNNGNNRNFAIGNDLFCIANTQIPGDLLVFKIDKIAYKVSIVNKYTIHSENITDCCFIHTNVFKTN